MKSTKQCAYCGGRTKLTREHIWPKSIVQHVQERAKYAPNIAKLIWSDLVIKDVCEPCNNGPLSKLDSYGSKLFERYFSAYITTSASVLFEYNFPTLARWLLKLSFNSARSNRSDVERLSRYASALIDQKVPLPDDFSISLDLVLPAIVPGLEREMLPASNRLCRILFTKGVGDWCTVRLVAINSYYFWILIQDKPDYQVNMDHVHAVLSKIRGTYLTPSANQVLLSPSGTTTMEMHSDWALALRTRVQ